MDLKDKALDHESPVEDMASYPTPPVRHGPVRRVSADAPIHRLAEMLPPMNAEEYRALKASIQASSGLRDPVWLWNDQIIDGKHRARACRELGIPLTGRDIIIDEGASLVQAVADLNVRRRHLTKGQAATCAVLVAAELEQEAKERSRLGAAEGGRRSGETRRGEVKQVASVPPPSSADAAPASSGPAPVEGKSRDLAAEMFGVSPRYVQEAKRIQKEAPNIFERIRAGKVTVAQANREYWEQEKRRIHAEKSSPSSPYLAQESTAYHEAGHAVVCYVLWADMGAVTIAPDSPRLAGQADVTASPEGKPAERLRDDILIRLAGEEAEVRWCNMPATAKLGARGDLEAIRKAKKGPTGLSQVRLVDDGLASDGGGAVCWTKITQHKYVAWLRAVTRDILGTACIWRAVKALAEELLRRKTVTGEEATAIIAAKTGRMERWQW